MTNQTTFINGLYFNKPVRCPGFIVMKGTINVTEVIAAIKELAVDGQLHFQVNKSKKGGYYGCVDSYRMERTVDDFQSDSGGFGAQEPIKDVPDEIIPDLPPPTNETFEDQEY